MALLKLLGTLFLVLLVVPLTAKAFYQEKKIPIDSFNFSKSSLERKTWFTAFRETTKDYGKSLNYIFIRTVPLMLLAGFFGASLGHLWKFELLIGLPVSLKTLALISFMGTFLPLPIAFDLMLAQALLMSGMSEGFVMALLFTLGTFSIYSAMIVFRTFSLKLAISLYLIVSLMGISLGYAADEYSNYRYVKWLEKYENLIYELNSKLGTESSPPVSSSKNSPKKTYFSTTKRLPKPFWTYKNISIESIIHKTRNSTSKKQFRKILGPNMGITFSNNLTPETFFDPLFFGRGIASGDLNGDGWIDLAIATNNGFELYQNLNGKHFKKISINDLKLIRQEAINIALIDLNNDGVLDIFYTVFDEGNFLKIGSPTNPQGNRILRVPNQDALVTSATSFGDWNRDGFLDMVNGNYFLGTLTRSPFKRASNQRVINQNLKFTIENLDGIPGQTHTILISDWDNNGWLDLMVGNDYGVADSYYQGKPDGGLRKIKFSDGFIPITTQNTMSMDSGDFNNDLVPDFYLANIGLSRGIDVVSNIFGRTMKNSGLDFCDSGRSVLNNLSCRNLLKFVTLLNPEKLDMSEKCLSLSSNQMVKECMITRLALFATKRNTPNLCKKISNKTSLSRKWCQAYFQSKKMKIKTNNEIPLKAFTNILFKGTQKGKFEDVSNKTGVTIGEWSWNSKFADLDNDEWQDIYIVNGVLVTQDFTSNNFYHNKLGQRFEKAETEFGLDDYDHSSSYTYIDFDNDGDLDIIANTLYGPFKVYINEESQNNSLTFRLRDYIGNRYCVGCKIIIHYGPDGQRHQLREIKAGGGFRSFDAAILHFGLGHFNSVQKVQVFWSTGETSILEKVFPANREYQINRKNLN